MNFENFKLISVGLGIFTDITHTCSKTEYAKYAKVFPLAKTLEFKVPSKWYRRVVGCLEILSGIMMMAIPSRGQIKHSFGKRAKGQVQFGKAQVFQAQLDQIFTQ